MDLPASLALRFSLFILPFSLLLPVRLAAVKVQARGVVVVVSRPSRNQIMRRQLTAARTRLAGRLPAPCGRRSAQSRRRAEARSAPPGVGEDAPTRDRAASPASPAHAHAPAAESGGESNGAWCSPRLRGLLLINLACAACGRRGGGLERREALSARSGSPFLFPTRPASQVALVKSGQLDLGSDEVYAAGRFAVAAFFFAPWLLRGLRSRATLVPGIQLGLLSAVALGLQNEALTLSTASHTAFLSGLTARALFRAEGGRRRAGVARCEAALRPHPRMTR